MVAIKVFYKLFSYYYNFFFTISKGASVRLDFSIFIFYKLAVLFVLSSLEILVLNQINQFVSENVCKELLKVAFFHLKKPKNNIFDLY